MSAVPQIEMRRESWLRSLADYYATMMRTQVLMQFQYRASTYMYTLGMVAEPTIYLVVWTTIARTHGGSIDGIDTGAFAAYYIVWTLAQITLLQLKSKRKGRPFERPLRTPSG